MRKVRSPCAALTVTTVFPSFSEYITSDFLALIEQSLGLRLAINIMRLVICLGLIAIVIYTTKAHLIEDDSVAGNFFAVLFTFKYMNWYFTWIVVHLCRVL